MIATANEAGRRGHAAPSGVAGWLGLAATPTFAVMALLASLSGESADMMCAAAHSMSSLSGMVPMYVLMSAFHSAPWLRLIARWRYFSAARGFNRVFRQRFAVTPSDMRSRDRASGGARRAPRA